MLVAEEIMVGVAVHRVVIAIRKKETGVILEQAVDLNLKPTLKLKVVQNLLQ